eukprot:7862729-Alexandrium_andersonii.AAC.1
MTVRSNLIALETRLVVRGRGFLRPGPGHCVNARASDMPSSRSGPGHRSSCCRHRNFTPSTVLTA